MEDSGHETRGFTSRLLVVIVVVSLVAITLFLAWQVSQALLVVFASILLGIVLDAPTRFLTNRTKLPRLFALALVLTILATLIFLFAHAIGPRLSEQIAQLGERVPQAVEHLKKTLGEQPWAQIIVKNFPEPGKLFPSGADILGRITGVFSSAIGALANIVIISLIGIYFAVDPALYINSVLRLLPASKRSRGRTLFAALGQVLRWWLVGRIASMLAVGILTTIGLIIIGMPLALALGVIAGLLSFVPYFGPIISAVPALLIALVESPVAVLYVLLVYSSVQFIEGNFLTPGIQRRAVSLLPAVLLISQLLMGVLFGLFGVVLAAPFAVTVIVIVQMIYIEDVLGEKVKLLGEH